MSEQQGDYIGEAMDMMGQGYDDQEIVDDSDLRKYRIELPNLCDDDGLDPYEFRLLAHYKRVGRCTEGTRTTAEKCKMSPAQVSEKRKSLAEKKWIDLKEVPLKKGGFSYIITTKDRWLENFKKYSPRSRGEHPRSLSEHPVHQVKQRINHIKKEPIKKREAAPPTPPPPEVKVFVEVTGKYPRKNNFDDVVTAVQKVVRRLGKISPEEVREELLFFFNRWTGNAFNPMNLAWLDWAVAGSVPTRGNWSKPSGNHQTNSSEDPYTDADRAVAAEIRRERGLS